MEASPGYFPTTKRVGTIGKLEEMGIFIFGASPPDSGKVLIKGR